MHSGVLLLAFENTIILNLQPAKLVLWEKMRVSRPDF
jgi:hypothetical protein